MFFPALEIINNYFLETYNNKYPHLLIKKTSKMSEKEAYDHDCEVLLKTFCRFSLKELKAIVAEKFVGISWQNVVEYISDNSLSLNNKNAAYFLYRYVKEQTPAHKFKVRLTQILLTEMYTHSNRRKWYSFEMRGRGVNQIIKSGQLMRRVTEQCEESAITALCEVRQFEQFYWIIIQEYKSVKIARNKKGETKKHFKTPVYFAAAFKEPYIFTTSRNISDELLLIVSTALGYDACKQLRFSDKNVTEMLKFLKIKEGRAAAAADFEIPSFHEGEPEVSEGGGVNFIGLKDRIQHVEQRFGREPPKLTNICFKAREKFNETEIPELESIKFPLQVTYKSENVWESIKSTLIRTDTIDFPHPMYLEQSMLSGKSSILLVSKDVVTESST